MVGIAPLLAGYGLVQYGLQNTEILPFSLGISLLVLGGGLLLKICIERQPAPVLVSTASSSSTGIFAAVIGLTILAYWALPFDVLAQVGLPRFQGALKCFFIAGKHDGNSSSLGACRQRGTGCIAAPQTLLLVSPPAYHGTSGLSYPLHHRFRTGLSLLMFSLVIFAMTVMQ